MSKMSSINSYQVNAGNYYWSYDTQPNYIIATDQSPSWWIQNDLLMSLNIDPGVTVIVQSLDASPILGSAYWFNPYGPMSMSGLLINIMTSTVMESLPSGYLYACITNVGNQSVTINNSDVLGYVMSSGLM